MNLDDRSFSIHVVHDQKRCSRASGASLFSFWLHWPATLPVFGRGLESLVQGLCGDVEWFSIGLPWFPSKLVIFWWNYVEFHGIEWDFMAIEWASMGFNAIKKPANI